jgi:hypothetical protein
MKTKRFDCVRMKRAGAERVLAETAGMSRDQELRFWQAQTDALRRRQQAIRSGQAEGAAADSPA